MLIPSIFAENLFDDWFDFPSVRNMDRQLYGRHFAREMKTDVHEHDDHYEVDIDLPGFQKDQIQLSLNIPKKAEKKLPEKKLIAIE